MSDSAPPVASDVGQGPITPLPRPAATNHQSAIGTAIPAIPISSHLISLHMVEIFSISFGWMITALSRVHAVTAGDLFLGVEFTPSARDLFGAHSRDVVVIELPRRVRAPAARRLHRGLCAGRRFQQTKCQLKGQCL